MWYEDHAMIDHFTFIFLDFLPKVIPTWQSRDIMRWECHYSYKGWNFVV